MKQYRLLEIATQYDLYLRQFYSTHNIDNLSYSELFSALVEDGFAESDFLHRQLSQLEIESKLIFCNNRNLQDKWAADNKELSYFDILLLQIKEFSPDVILVSNINYFTREETIIIKECLPKYGKLVGFHFSTIRDIFMRNVSLYDQIYTGSIYYRDMMRENDIPAYLLRHAFEPSILDRLTDISKENKVCFLGSIFVGEDLHNNRLDMLDILMKSNISFDFYGDIHGDIKANESIMGTGAVASEEKQQKYLNVIREIEKDKKPSLFGIAYYNVLNQYNICINMHAPTIGNGAGNMRMYEAAGVGACLLTDYRDENSELFDINSEIVVYESLQDMAEKANWLLKNPVKAKKIALAGQKKTLKNYTYKNKAEQLNEYIQDLL